MAIAVPGNTSSALVPVGPEASRTRDIAPGCELRIIVDDDKHARLKLLPAPAGAKTAATATAEGKPPATSAEIFGSELVPGVDYPLLGGTRTAIYSWHGCRVQITGPTAQEYDAPNVVMRDYLSCAAVVEQRRQRAEDLDLPAPRVLVCGAAFSGKSVLCQTLCNYALRRERTPIFVDLDTRYSSIRQLQGLPACVSAIPVEHTADEECQRRLSYFYGHIDWSDNPGLYERVVFHLSRVTLAKLAHSVTPEGLRTATSGLVVNAPNQPTPELLQKVIAMFEIDIVFVLDHEGLHAALSQFYSTMPSNMGIPAVEVVPLPKAGGVVQSTSKRIRFLRALRMRDYFYGIMRDFHPYSVLVDLSDVQLVQIEATVLSSGMLPMGQEAEQPVDYVVAPYAGDLQTLENAMLAAVRANTMNEVLYAPICGLVLVTKVEERALQLLCPAPPPLPTQFLLVGDQKSLKFLDI